MANASDWRTYARATAYGTFGAIGAAAASAGLLTVQAEQAKRTIGVRSTSPPYADGRYGRSKGPSIRLVMIGDSLATSLGADNPLDTIGAMLASLVTEYDGRAVILSTVAVVGSQSKDLKAQVARALNYQPHVAIIIIGGNDVTHMVPQRRSIRLLDAAIRRLRRHGTHVVVGTTPDMGTVAPIQPPLSWVLRRTGRSLARAQTICVAEAEGRAVPMADILGPEFDLRPEALFSSDQFHPSTAGYEAIAQALAPSVLAALSRGSTGELLPDIVNSPATELQPQDPEEARPGSDADITPAGGISEPRLRRFRWTRSGRRKTTATTSDTGNDPNDVSRPHADKVSAGVTDT